jgi:hypothetical protein
LIWRQHNTTHSRRLLHQHCWQLPVHVSGGCFAGRICFVLSCLYSTCASLAMCSVPARSCYTSQLLPRFFVMCQALKHVPCTAYARHATVQDYAVAAAFGRQPFDARACAHSTPLDCCHCHCVMHVHHTSSMLLMLVSICVMHWW